MEHKPQHGTNQKIEYLLTFGCPLKNSMPILPSWGADFSHKIILSPLRKKFLKLHHFDFMLVQYIYNLRLQQCMC